MSASGFLDGGAHCGKAMNSIKLLVATDPIYYGPDASPQDIQDFADFACQYLERNGYEHVEIELVERYPSGAADVQASLREEIWSAYRGN